MTDILQRLLEEHEVGPFYDLAGNSIYGDAAAEIKRLRDGYRRILDSTNYEMRDGDLARDIAEQMLAGVED